MQRLTEAEYPDVPLPILEMKKAVMAEAAEMFTQGCLRLAKEIRTV